MDDTDMAMVELDRAMGTLGALGDCAVPDTGPRAGKPCSPAGWRCDSIPRRDTDSAITQVVGAMFFPARHSAARFAFREDWNGTLHLRVMDANGLLFAIAARPGTCLAETSAFESLGDASDFSRSGCDGYAHTSHMGDLMAGNGAQAPQTVLNGAISTTSDTMQLAVSMVSGPEMVPAAANRAINLAMCEIRGYAPGYAASVLDGVLWGRRSLPPGQAARSYT